MCEKKELMEYEGENMEDQLSVSNKQNRLMTEAKTAGGGPGFVWAMKTTGTAGAFFRST